jgi:copper ion binding protein
MPDGTAIFRGTATFNVSGMTCSHCERAVTAEVSAIDGVSAVSVDLQGGSVTISADRPVERAAVAAAVDEAGYTLVS